MSWLGECVLTSFYAQLTHVFDVICVVLAKLLHVGSVVHVDCWAMSVQWGDHICGNHEVRLYVRIACSVPVSSAEHDRHFVEGR